MPGPTRHCPAALLVAATLSLAPRLAQATPRVQLSYSAAPGVEGCPGEETLRQGVIAHLGHDPFAPGAGGRISVRIDERQGQLVAVVNTSGLDAQPPGQRELSGERSECQELVSSLALVLAIAIDPRSLAGPLPPPPPPPAAPPAAYLPALGALGTHRAVPGAGAWVELRRRASWGDVGGALSLTIDQTRTPLGGSIGVTFLLGELLACTGSALRICAASGLGAVRVASSGYTAAGQAWLPQFTLGPRVEWEPPLSSRLRPRLHLEAPLALQKTRLLVGNEVAGDLAQIGFRLGVSFFWGPR